MSTTSLKLPDDVKSRAAAAARQRGVTPHAFMVDAIRTAVSAAEQHAEFVSVAVAARETMRESGTGCSAAEVHSYLRARASGASDPKPEAKAWRS